MPALNPIPPATLKAILELAGLSIVDEDAFNWVLALGARDEPIVIPKRGKLVAVDVLDNALHRAQIDNLAYFQLLGRIQSTTPGSPLVN